MTSAVAQGHNEEYGHNDKCPEPGCEHDEKRGPTVHEAISGLPVAIQLCSRRQHPLPTIHPESLDHSAPLGVQGVRPGIRPINSEAPHP